MREERLCVRVRVLSLSLTHIPPGSLALIAI